MNSFWVAFWFFLPAGIANMTPIIATKIPIIKNWNTPMDFGLKFRGNRIFGANKTWRGLLVGLIMAVITGLLVKSFALTKLDWPDYLIQPGILISIFLGLGALLGDAVESFFKRQRSISSGHSWYPFDQLDYIIGGLLFASSLTGLSLELILYVTLIYFGLHLLFSYIGYLLGFKKRPI